MSIKEAIALVPEHDHICDCCENYVMWCDDCQLRFHDNQTIYCINGEEHLCPKCRKAYKEEVLTAYENPTISKEIG